MTYAGVSSESLSVVNPTISGATAELCGVSKEKDNILGEDVCEMSMSM